LLLNKHPLGQMNASRRIVSLNHLPAVELPYQLYGRPFDLCIERSCGHRGDNLTYVLLRNLTWTSNQIEDELIGRIAIARP
jgi:hypothetical protein